MPTRVEVELQCSGCDGTWVLLVGTGSTAACSKCGTSLEPVTTEALLGRRMLERCVACGEHRIYRQKDFNRRAGLVVVIAGMALSLAVLSFSPMGAYGVLFGMAIFDGILYRKLPEVAICYRCKAKHRGWSGDSRLEPFDLLTADLIDQQVRESAQGRA